MAGTRADFRITGSRDLLRLRDALERAGRGDLKRRLGNEIRNAARPIQQDLRQTVRSLNVRGEGSASGRGRRETGYNGRSNRTAGLRESIARSISMSTSGRGNASGVRIFVDKSKLPSDMRNMPANLDDGHWRHPTFGRSPWHNQYARPWWRVTIDPHLPRVRQRVSEILNEIADELENSI